MNGYTDRRPYAATANVVAVLERVRSRNLPDKVDNDFLRIAGVGPAVFGRVRDALLFLSLVDEDGAPTDILRAMARAPELEYRQLLETAIRTAYRDDLDVVSPAQDSQAQIIEAFRKYEPRSQTARMVMLFLGLCQAAGMEVFDAPRERKMTTGVHRSAPRPRSTGSTTSAGSRKAKATRADGPSDPTETPPHGIVFGVTDDDIAALPDEEFDEVWRALGKVARARARARQMTEAALTLVTAQGVRPEDFDGEEDP